jgi:Mrp family chromosome partitioning ATPase
MQSIGAKLSPSLAHPLLPPLSPRMRVPSPVAVATLTLLRRLETLLPAAAGRVVQITSSHAGAGLTTLVEEMARAASCQLMQRVLLVDMPPPDGSSSFAMAGGGQPGLEDVGVRRTSLEEAEFPLTGLGCSGAVLRLAEGDSRWGGVSDLLGLLRQRYDLILIDTPPVPAALPSMLLSPMVDGVVLVVEAGRTHASSAREARDALRNNGANLAGAVLNRQRRPLPAWVYRWLS